MTSAADKRERKMRIVHKSMHMVLDSLESFCMAGFIARTRNSVELNCFSVPMCDCCDIPGGKRISEI